LRRGGDIKDVTSRFITNGWGFIVERGNERHRKGRRKLGEVQEELGGRGRANLSKAKKGWGPLTSQSYVRTGGGGAGATGASHRNASKGVGPIKKGTEMCGLVRKPVGKVEVAKGSSTGFQVLCSPEGRDSECVQRFRRKGSGFGGVPSERTGRRGDDLVRRRSLHFHKTPDVEVLESMDYQGKIKRKKTMAQEKSFTGGR